MAKSAEDFEKLLTQVHGSSTPEAVRYWMARMRELNEGWNTIGGKMSYYKRTGTKVTDYGTTSKFPAPPTVVTPDQVNKEVLVKQSPITFAGVKPQKPMPAAAKVLPEAKKAIAPVGGSFEGGTQATRNLWLPFAGLAALVVVVVSVFGGKKKRRR